MPTLKALYRYPIKSLGRESLERIELDEYGIKDDRRWMLVDQNQEFMTQRSYPAMTQISAAIKEDYCVLTHQSLDTIQFHIDSMMDETLETKVWANDVIVNKVSQEVSDWLSSHLGVTVHLVGAAASFKRMKVKEDYELPLRFQDGYPMLVLSQASIDLLNTKIDTSVTDDRFRANIIIDDCDAHEEDLHAGLRHPDYEISLVSACKRCILINTDQDSGEVYKEPLKTLSSYRRKENNVMFGMNAAVEKAGILRIGDVIQFQK